IGRLGGGRWPADHQPTSPQWPHVAGGDKDKVAAPVFAGDALRVTGCPRPPTLVTDIHTACTLVDLKFLPEQACAACLPWLRKPTMELGMQRYKVLDENAAVLGSG